MDGSEFKTILLPCYRRMYATAMAILRNADDASDAVQDAISALWQKRADLPIPDNPISFCTTAVRNLCISRLRTESGRYFDNIDKVLVAESAESADTNASLKSTTELIGRVLDTFPEKQRRILSLSFLSQLSNDEICDVTGESPSNVRQIISRGRLKLKELLSNDIH